MGLIDRVDRPTYLSVFDKWFVIRTDSSNPKAESRTTKEGKTVYEIRMEGYSGLLIGVETNDGKYGKELILSLWDEKDGLVKLQLMLSGSHSRSFLMRVPKIDFSRTIELFPYKFVTEDGKKRSGFVIMQDGNKIESAFSKENPNGLPQLDKIIVKGEERWDDTKQIVFLVSVLSTHIPEIQQNKDRVDGIQDFKNTDTSPESTEDSEELDLPVVDNTPKPDVSEDDFHAPVNEDLEDLPF